MKININDLICKLIILFPISTVLQGISILNNINKILIALILGLLLLKIVTTKILRNDLIILLFSLIVYISSFMFTQKTLDNFNDIFYFALWILLFIWMKQNYKNFKQIILSNKKFIEKVIIVWNIIVIISFFFKSSYTYKWGSANYFRSFSNGEHRLAGACIFVVALVWIIAQENRNKKYLMFSIVPIISIYLTGTRTYLGVIVIFLLIIYYMMCSKKIYFYLTLVPICLLLILLIMFTPMKEKFIISAEDGYWGFWGTITNGRTVFWKADLIAFSELDGYKKFLGNGYNFIYDVNEIAIHDRIWAHNDVINVLLTYGYIGVIIYLYVFITFSNKVLKEMNVNRIIKYGYYFIWFFNAMLNMVYTYICATLALPFILYSLTEYNIRNGVKNENNNINTNV